MSSSIFDGIKHNKAFEKLCKMKQHELKNHLKQKLNMQCGDGWLYKEGTFPVLLTAHMDTVHKNQCKHITYGKTNYGDTYCTSPEGIGGDDRCGIYMAMKILEQIDCSVLFCEDEEIGSIGAGKFVETDLCKSLKGKFKYIIELDRANDRDAVFYHDGNEEFHDFILKEFWVKAQGSWSDICTLSPALEISSVNFSCGYYKPHTTQEYVVLEEMEWNISEIIRLLQRTDVNAEPFKYVEEKVISHSGYGLLSRYGLLSDYYDTPTTKTETSSLYGDVILEVVMEDGNYLSATGADENEAWVNFFFENPTVCSGQIADFYTY